MGKLQEKDIKEFVDKGYDTFIETGTGPGAVTIHNIKEAIKEIHSIELSEKIYNSNKNLLKDKKNINLYLGDSAIILKDIIENNKSKKCIIWLDAHFSGGDTKKSETFGECPIIEEIKMLSTLETPPIIFIDDAAYFLSPPPAENHKQEDWPTFDLIKKEIIKINKNYKEENIRQDIYLFKY